MVGDCIGNVWGMCGGVMGYCWDGFGWKVMAMVRDLSGILVGY